MTVLNPDQNINHFNIDNRISSCRIDWKLLNHVFIIGNIPKIWGYEYLQRNVLQVTSKKDIFPFNMQFFQS